MDARFGDPSISAPTEGSWNEMPPLRKPVKTDPFGAQSDINNNKVGRLKALMRSQTVSGSPDYSVGTTTTITAARVDNFPRHPMVDMHNHQRSVSVDRIQGRLENQRNSSSSSRPRLSSSPHRHRTSYDSCSGSDADDDRDPETDSVSRRDMVRHYTANRSRSQEDHWRAQQKASPPLPTSLPTPHRQHKSPPLSSTAMMRRYSSQSESTRTFASSTPSTASFSSKHTSMTTPGLHGFSGSVVPPLLKEEEGHGMMFGDEYIPPVPSLRDNKAAASASSSPPSASSRGPSRNGRAKQKQFMAPVGPQELVPSNDELWGY